MRSKGLTVLGDACTLRRGVYGRDEEHGDCPCDTKRKRKQTLKSTPSPCLTFGGSPDPWAAPRTGTAKRCRGESTVRSRLNDANDQSVGNRGAATVFTHPKLLRNWDSPEGELRKSVEGDGPYHAGGGTRSLHPSSTASTKDKE